MHPILDLVRQVLPSLLLVQTADDKVSPGHPCARGSADSGPLLAPGFAAHWTLMLEATRDIPFLVSRSSTLSATFLLTASLPSR